MADVLPEDAPLQGWLDKLRQGDPGARDQLIRHSCDRLRALTGTMLRRFAAVKRWEDTDDVFQNALVRLCAALKEVEPANVSAFFGLAALQIRRELIDLARHYYGAEGLGARHASAGDHASARTERVFDKADLSNEPSRLADLTEVHELVDTLPEDERAVFDLLWYQELPQAQAAALLNVSVPTVKRRWLAARRRLHRLLKSD